MVRVPAAFIARFINLSSISIVVRMAAIRDEMFQRYLRPIAGKFNIVRATSPVWSPYYESTGQRCMRREPLIRPPATFSP